MEVTFTPDSEDYWKYRKYRLAHDFWYVPARFAALFLFIFAGSWAFNRDTALAAFMAAVAAPFHLVWMLLHTKAEVRRLVRDHPYWVQDQLIVISQEGLTWRGSGLEAAYPWKQFVALGDIGEYILFRLPRWRALILPKRAFADPTEAHAFFEAAQSFWYASAAGVAPFSREAVWPPAPRVRQGSERDVETE